MAPPSAVTDYSKATDAKDFLDIIGKDVYETVKKEAETYKGELEGKLSQASIFVGETVSSNDPCNSDYTTHFDANSKGRPCRKEDVNRFSDKQGAECTKSKIKDSESDSVGACAPFRRLHVCDKNMENMDTNNNDGKAKHNLLLDVCHAAKYEGDSITRYHPQHKETNPDSKICTELARSFADIGDIVRGTDLYLGNKKKNQTERDQLESKLKEIFGKIHSEVMKTRGKNVKKQSLQERYKDDTPDFLKLREDWWTANRHTVWEAITCSDKLAGASYFRKTCNDDETLSYANHKCRCKDKKGAKDTDQVPTYFDYVPQFLRWFEEWAEDFCRKKKKYVDIVKTYCRKKDNSSEERYCSRNGFDCEQTVNARGKLRYGKQCTDCFFACNPYVDWINNQKEQFDKQKNKYDEEMQKYTNEAPRSSRKTRAATTTNYDGYESKFYNILKERDYGTVETFLEKLSKEKTCTAITDGGTIDFKQVNSASSTSGGTAGGGTSDTSGTNDKEKGTFYRSEYCQPCPYCGMKKKVPGKEWEKRSENDECKSGNLYKPIDKNKGTPIEILKSGENRDDIRKKIDDFCAKTQNGSDGSGGVSGRNSDSSLYDRWQCYKGEDVEIDGKDEEDIGDYENVKAAGGLCILQKTNEEGVQKQKTFYDFFYYWVAHMLKDSIYWRMKKLERCLQNGNPMKCKDKCKTPCDCFEKWIEQKETEWKLILEHFKKQGGFDSEGDKGNSVGDLGMTHDVVLEGVLKEEFLKGDSEDGSTQDTQNSLNAEELKHLKHLSEMLQKENAQGTAGAPVTGKRTIMDKLIDYEKEQAQTCLKTHKSDTCPQSSTPESAARSLPGDDVTSPNDPPASEDDSDEEEIDDVGENVHVDEVEEADSATAEEVEEPQEDDNVEKVCQIVGNALTETNLKDACTLKYVTGKNYGWRCVPTTSGGSETTGKSDGSICVPPRRRRLYVTPLTKLTGDNTETSQPQTGGGSESTSVGKTASQDPSDKLREAFIQSAAVETFFAWHRYKKEWEAQKNKTQNGLGGEAVGLQTIDGDDEDPEQQLSRGDIPPSFLRQMFYTLADYKDILFSGSNDVTSGNTACDKTNIVLLASGSTEEKAKMEKIQQKITDMLNKTNSGTTPTHPGTPSDEQRKKWWNDNAEHIWKGMVCSLTYEDKSNGSMPTEGDSNTQKITQDQTAYGNLLEKIKDKDGEYHYEKVVLKEDENSVPKSTTTTQSTTLKDFVLRPTYFRYLEEWGETFCRQRTRMLEKIEEECRSGKVCSGDGEDCKTILSQKYTTFPDFYCPDCAKYCSSYRRWIERKKDEFTQQSNAYTGQKDKCVNGRTGAEGNDHDSTFSVTLKSCTTAGAFLERLKNGPCKNNNNGADKLDFTNPKETFRPAENCKPCSEFNVNCKVTGNCDTTKGEGCEKKDHIYAKDINGSTEVLDMLVSDDNKKEFKDGLEEACGSANIFKGIRKDEWLCGNVCGYNVCKPKNVNGETFEGKANGEKQIIFIRALFKRWLEYFVQDYNKIRTKLKPCMNKVEQSPCIIDYEKKFKCVNEWINQKRDEWKNIKEHYLKQNEHGDNNMKSLVSNFLGALQPQTDVKKATGHKGVIGFENSCHCNGSASSGKKGDTPKDIVECLLDKLEKEAKKCEEKHSGQTCPPAPPETLDDEEDLTLEETEENTEEAKKKMMPKFCNIDEPKETEEEGDKCEEATAPPPSDNKVEKPEETPKAPEPEEEAPERPPAPPPLAPSDESILHTTIPFGVALALGSIAFFFMKNEKNEKKKKEKRNIKTNLLK
ncbi:hypothetical protein PFBG_04119 [Plasmodium falciparum 7G8]|uniref:Erythrocyte membrane protein 1 n=1 Tax=Plasmodium falciparum (isolate 7G8) TaxID=57266 RepID=W7FIT7_PLAF8|nr:hypothetical protein PFBG_04119 [Plasmodium falciparum 7G8]